MKLRGTAHPLGDAYRPLSFPGRYPASAVFQFLRPVITNGDLIEGLVWGLHMGVVALAAYELARIVYQKYDRLRAPRKPLI